MSCVFRSSRSLRTRSFGVYGGTAWEPWPPRLAAERFLAELEGLSAAIAAPDKPRPRLAKASSSVA